MFLLLRVNTFMEIEDYHEDVVIKIAVWKVFLPSQVTFQKFIMKVSNYIKALFRIVQCAIRNLQNKAIYKITFQKFIKACIFCFTRQLHRNFCSVAYRNFCSVAYRNFCKYTTEISVPLTTEISVKSTAKADETS